MEESNAEPVKKSRKVGRQRRALPDDGASDQLMDMRHVRLNEKRHDRTIGQENARRFMDEDPKAFNAQLASLEKEHRASKAGRGDVGEGVEGGEDEGTEACVALVEKLIGELTK